MVYQTNFLIVGAGIAGLSIAVGLQQLNTPFLLIDKMPIIKGIGAGLGITSNAIEAFKILGLDKAVIDVAHPLASLKIVNHHGHIIADGNPQQISAYNLTNYALHRADLHEALLSKVNAQQLLCPAALQSIEKTATGYTVTCSNNVIIHCKYIIGADGIHSPVRQYIFPHARIRYAGYTCWRSTVVWEGALPETSTETWGPKGRFGLTPLRGNRVYWYACINSPTERAEKFKKYSIQDLAENFKDYHANIQKALALTNPDKLLLNDICDLNPLPQYHMEGIVLIGDAAHATTPNLGQGACMGIEDAAVLFQALKNQDTRSAFDQFSRRRVSRCTSLVKKAWRMGKIAQLDNPLLIPVRNAVIARVPKSMQAKALESILDVSKVLYY